MYTASLWVRADAPGATLKLKLREFQGSTSVGSATAQLALTSSWQQLSVSYTPAAPGLSTLDLNAFVSSAVPGTCFYADDASIIVSALSTDVRPNAVLSVSPSAGVAPVDVTADASGSVDGDATPIASYRFDFGDGSAPVGPQVGATAAHTYTSAGTFTVAVTVTDTVGQSSTATSQVTVSAGIVKNSSFETDTSGWNVSGSGAGVVLARVAGGHSGSWSAQLSNTSGATATCLLNDSPNWVATSVAGIYTASLWVRADTAGASLKLRLREFRKDTGAAVGAASVQVALTTAWQKVSLQYAPLAAGASTLDYSAYVSSAPPGVCFYADDAAVALDAAPAAALTAIPASGAAPLAVTADASASSDTDTTPIASYKFDFGDGSAAVGPQPSPTAIHTYTTAGSYTVTVTVTDTAGGSSAVATQIQVS
jgi:PKD repeat protein